MLQCASRVANLLQCACHVAVCGSVHVVLQCVAVCMPCCNVLQCACRVASVLQCASRVTSVLQSACHVALCGSVHVVLHCVAVCESRLGHALAFLHPSAVLLDCVPHCTLECTTNALCGYMRERERVHGCVESTETQRKPLIFMCM